MVSEEALSREDKGQKKDKKEEKKPLLREGGALRIEPKRTTGLKPKELNEVPSRETVEGQEEAIVPPRLAGAGTEMPFKKTKGKHRPFFRFLFILSLIFMMVTAGLLLLPILDISIPDFLTPAVEFVNKLFPSSK